MNLTRVVAVVCVLVASSFAQEGDRTASPWKVLFDGASSDGWRSFRGKEFPSKGWAVENGTLRHLAGGGGGDIATADEYGDFDFRFEWKVAEGANSGVMYRSSESENAPWMTAPEYQILDDAKHADGKDPKTSAAGCYALYEGVGKVLRPVGEFNEGRIVAIGTRVEHWLNGVRVVAFDTASEEWKAKVKASKFKDMPRFGTTTRGRIVLQDHGDDVWYRNIRIRTFEGGASRRLFNGKDLSGWKAHLEPAADPAGTWSVEDGVLVCKGSPSGYVKTEADFEHFILSLSWRFSPVTKAEGNSGVLFRMTGPDKVWPRCLEAQLMSRNAGDFFRIGGFSIDTDPARTKGVRTAKLVAAENPVGEWNRYEIEVDGGDVELRVNGKVVNRGTKADLGAGKICLQSEGVEIHFKDVEIVPVKR